VTGSGEVSLAEFLLARVAEDAAAGERAVVWPTPNGLAWIGPTQESATLLAISGQRLLAECDAKRRIVEDALFAVRVARRRPGWTLPDADIDAEGQAYRRGVENQRAQELPDVLDRTERLFRLLAVPYAGHADFRPGWKL
jgi:hypothetical protein